VCTKSEIECKSKFHSYSNVTVIASGLRERVAKVAIAAKQGDGDLTKYKQVLIIAKF